MSKHIFHEGKTAKIVNYKNSDPELQVFDSNGNIVLTVCFHEVDKFFLEKSLKFLE